MNRVAGITLAAAVIAGFGFVTNSAMAAKADSAYAQKKAECKRDAKAKHFGIHFVQRDRWIKNCIAGSRT